MRCYIYPTLFANYFQLDKSMAVNYTNPLLVPICLEAARFKFALYLDLFCICLSARQLTSQAADADGLQQAVRP